MREHFNAIFFSLVVVRDGDRYLLVEERDHENQKVWFLPAGGVELGEDFLSAAIRETQEESGIVIEPVGILGTDQVLGEDGRSTKIRMVFLGEMKGGVLKSHPDHESNQAAWFSMAEISRLPLRHEEVNEWIRVAEHFRGHPLPRLTCYKAHLD